ncbi:MAG: aminopeptidase P family protein [Candidatus Humimicrobiaceae bacterium]
MENSNCNNRINKLKNEIVGSHNISSILIFKEEDIFYLSRFFGKNSNSALLVTDKKNYLFVNFIYLEEAKKTVSLNDVEIIKYTGDKNKVISEILSSDNIRDILIQSNFISHSDYLKLESQLNEFNIKIRSIENPLEALRLIKDDYEQKLIRKACRLTDKSFNHICSLSYEDLVSKRESSLAVEIEKFLVESGGCGKSFDYVVAGNNNSSKPHYAPGFKKINEGILLLDYGVVFKNYCSDITRTIFIGKKIKTVLKQIYEIVQEAQMMAVDFCREGIKASELDNIARKYITDKGYGENFGHSLGHGIGLEIHEPPWINQKNEQILREGMVVTIEPGIYIENLGGIRIEDMVIVRKNGCENLYSSSKKALQVY